jgi:ferredoxin
MNTAVIVTVDRERCVGSATCTVVAPGIFALDEHDRAEPQAAVVTDADLVDQARCAVPHRRDPPRACPRWTVGTARSSARVVDPGQHRLAELALPFVHRQVTAVHPELQWRALAQVAPRAQAGSGANQSASNPMTHVGVHSGARRRNWKLCTMVRSACSGATNRSARSGSSSI